MARPRSADSAGVNPMAAEKLETYFGPMLNCPNGMKALFPLLIALMMVCAPLVRGQTNEFSPPLRAQQLMGLKVEDTDGRTIGSIRNLILDTHSGQLKYAVIGSGGFLGVRSTLRLAPSQIMSAATTKRDTLAINTIMAHWIHAPVFRSSQLASLSEPDRAREIADYFEAPDITASAGILTATGSGAAKPTNAQPAGNAAAQPESLKFASDLIGLRVVNSKQQRMGEVLNLLVSFGAPHPIFAVVSTGKYFRRGHRYVMLLSALRSEGGNVLVTDVGSSALESAPPFTQKVWDTMNLSGQPAVYSYSKSAE